MPATAFNAHLAHRYGRSPAQSLAPSGRLTSMQEKRIKTYITANLSRPMTIHQIADASGFHADDLCSGFLAATGQPVLEWISECRVNMAKSFLSKSGEPIAKIAEICGFSDEDVLIEIFEKVAGMAPQEWRSRNRH